MMTDRFTDLTPAERPTLTHAAMADASADLGTEHMDDGSVPGSADGGESSAGHAL
jgi:hypothetical protein